MKRSLAAAVVAAIALTTGGVLAGAPMVSATTPNTVTSLSSPDTYLQTLAGSSYKSLLDRVQSSGFTPTSVTGAYSDMYIRDGSVQAMATLAAGDNGVSRAMLRYMLRYGAAAGLDRAPHRVPPPSDTVSTQASQTTTSTKVAALGGKLSVTQRLAPVGAVTAFWAYLAPSAGARGPVVATLRTGTDASATNDVVDVESVDASQIPASGGWVKFSFLPPLSATRPTGGYAVTLSAPGAAANSIAWQGTGSATTGQPTYLQNAGSSPTQTTTTAAFKTGTTTFASTGFDDFDETDQNYSLLLSWARYVHANPGDSAFVTETWPTVRTFANYYLDNNSINTNLNLIYNNALDDEGLNPAYDLLTNSFTAEALHELAPIAQRLGDSTNTTKWNAAATQLSSGINTKLTTTVDGKKIYAAKYTSATSALTVGYSFANTAPIAAGWYGLDAATMTNTLTAYKAHAATTFGSTTMLEAMSSSTPASYLSTDGGKGVAWVLAKSLGWEMYWYGKTGDTTSLANDETFLKNQWTDSTKPVAEGWTKYTDATIHTTDPGNQEHDAWFVYELLSLYPQLASTLPNPPAVTVGTSGTITGLSGLCLDVRKAGTTDGTPVQIYGCNSTPAQSWTPRPDGTIQALGNCLTVGNGGTAKGTLVVTSHCDGTAAQQWVPQTNGSLRNPQSGRCLDDPAASTTAGTQVEIWDCNGGANQQWKLFANQS